MIRLLLLMLIVGLVNSNGIGSSTAEYTNNPISQILSSTDEHFLVFDKVGEMASSTTYMHVMLPLNFTSIQHQINEINDTLYQVKSTKLFEQKGYWEKLTLYDHLDYNVNALLRRLQEVQSSLDTVNDLLPEVDAFQRSYRTEEEGRFPQPPEIEIDTFSHLGHPTLKRHKRWIFGLLGGVVGTLFGLYNHYEIQNIAAKVTDIEHTQNLLIHLTAEHTRQIEQISKATDKLYDALTAYTQVNPQIIYIEFNELVSQLERKMITLNNVVQRLQDRRLSSDWLTKDQMNALHETVLKYTKDNHYTLLSNLRTHYLQLELSYVRNKDGVIGLLHIPCITSKKLKNIMRYVPFPIPLQNPTEHSSYSVQQSLTGQHNLGASVITETLSKSEALYLVAEADHIAIDGDNRFRLLKEADFASCIQHNRLYLCDHHKVEYTKPHTTCLGSLYLKNVDGVRKNCRFEKRPLKEEVFQIDSNTWLVYSPHQQVSNVVCNNGSSFTAEFGKVTRLHVPDGCSVDLETLRITVQDTVKLPLPTMVSAWRWDPLSLPADLLHSLPHLDAAFNTLSKAMEEKDTATMEHVRNITMQLNNILEERALESIISERPSNTMLIFIVCGCLFFLILVLYLFLKYRSKKNGQINVQNEYK